jgi:hypothetical protein
MEKIVKVRMIVLYPATDRFTGQTEEKQWQELSEK